MEKTIDFSRDLQSTIAGGYYFKWSSTFRVTFFRFWGNAPCEKPRIIDLGGRAPWRRALKKSWRHNWRRVGPVQAAGIGAGEEAYAGESLMTSPYHPLGMVYLPAFIKLVFMV